RRCDMKPDHWVGSSREDLKSFPTELKRDIGFALERVFSKLSRIMMAIRIEPFTPCALLRPSMYCIVSRRNRSVASRHRRRASTLVQRVCRKPKRITSNGEKQENHNQRRSLCDARQR